MAIALLAAALPGTAVAAGAQVLVIDSGNKYAGMAKTYSQGYLPAVSHGKATVVLPLVINTQSGVAAVKDDSITVTPEFGDPSTSPFVFSNTQAKVNLAANAVNGTAATVQSWLLTFSFPLESRRVNGRYPLTLHVAYALADGTAQEQAFTVYVTITDGINPNATPKPAATPKPTPPPLPQPRLIVSKYAVTPDVVQAGTKFTLDFDITNTSDTVNVRNIKVTVKGEGTDLMPVSLSNTLYIKSLAKDGTESLGFEMKARYDAQPKPQKVNIAIDYEDGNGTAYTASDEILVQMTQAIRLEFDKPNIAANVTAGDTVPVSLNVFNMGRNALMNVMCKVAAPGLLPEGSVFLGTLDAGGSKTAELFVFVGTRDMSLSETGDIVHSNDAQNLYGGTEGVINVSYEDEFGNKYSQQVKLATTIGEPAAPAPTAAPDEPKAEAGQWGISIAVAGGAIIVIAAALLILRKRRVREVAKGDETD